MILSPENRKKLETSVKELEAKTTDVSTERWIGITSFFLPWLPLAGSFLSLFTIPIAAFTLGPSFLHTEEMYGKAQKLERALKSDVFTKAIEGYLYKRLSVEENSALYRTVMSTLENIGVWKDTKKQDDDANVNFNTFLQTLKNENLLGDIYYLVHEKNGEQAIRALLSSNPAVSALLPNQSAINAMSSHLFSHIHARKAEFMPRNTRQGETQEEHNQDFQDLDLMIRAKRVVDYANRWDNTLVRGMNRGCKFAMDNGGRQAANAVYNSGFRQLAHSGLFAQMTQYASSTAASLLPSSGSTTSRRPS